MDRIFAKLTVSISELRKSPMSVVDACNNEAIAILNRNEVVAYIVPASAVHANSHLNITDEDMDKLVHQVIGENGESIKGLSMNDK